MKKNIITTLLIVSNLFFVVYAFIKADEASKSQMFADQQRSEVEKLRVEASNMRDRAQESAASALQEKARAEEALAKCQGK